MRIQNFQNIVTATLQRKLSELRVPGLRYLPRYVVVLLDISLICMALGITYMALTAINVSFYTVLSIPVKMTAILGVNILFFFLFRTYSGVIRHSSFIDILKLTFASLGTIFTLALVQYSWYFATGNKIFLMVGVILYTVLSFTFLLIFRVFVKQLYHTFKEIKNGTKKKKVVILGTDDHSISLGKALATQSGQAYHLVGFLSRDPYKSMRIAGKPVISVGSSLRATLLSLNIDGVLIIGKTLTIEEKTSVVNDCLATGLQVFNGPLVEEWNAGKDVAQNIRSIEIEELLDRERIQLDEEEIKKDLQAKTLLITGAAGSIGSELVRQIAHYRPEELVLVDQAESPLHALELELREHFPELRFRTVLANISNKYRMETLFRKHRFSMVFHAAAYKHVPVIENNPREAIVVNVLGTMNLANLSARYQVEKFVMVSTDKAVNPTNVMGASKRAAEMYVQSFQHAKEHTTQFITTRFGNVLGSNGSVIPHFKQQIAKGGPVTVTHPEIIRYFMTIPEACQLVLQAGTMGKGGEIFVFDMGKPVKILDLAKRMIRLSGLIPYTDIDIEITGLRPGEKLYEELLSDVTTTLPTHNEKIMIARDSPRPFNEIKEKTRELVTSAIKARDKRTMVSLLKELVPEFVSQNSQFEELDNPKQHESLRPKAV